MPEEKYDLPPPLAWRGDLVTLIEGAPTPGSAADGLWACFPSSIDPAAEIYVTLEPDGWRAFISRWRIIWGMAAHDIERMAAGEAKNVTPPRLEIPPQPESLRPMREFGVRD